MTIIQRPAEWRSGLSYDDEKPSKSAFSTPLGIQWIWFKRTVQKLPVLLYKMYIRKYTGKYGEIGLKCSFGFLRSLEFLPHVSA